MFNILKSIQAAGFFVVAMFGFYTFGPTIEAKLFPPLEREIIDPTRIGETLTIFFYGRKIRGCELDSVNSTWWFGKSYSTIPVALFRPDGTILTAPHEGTPFVVGDSFRSGPFTLRVPTMVDAIAETELRVINTYTCHIFWKVKVVTSIVVASVPREQR